MSIYTDIQTLSPGNQVTLFELDMEGLGGNTMRFHGHSQDGVIVWRGEQYYPWAITIKGISRNGSGKQVMPTLMVGNIGRDQVTGDPIPGVITALCIHFSDLVGARVTRIRTFAKYLDPVNFPDGLNPDADPDEMFPPEVWRVEQKRNETRESVEFVLSSPVEFAGKKVPSRPVSASPCHWLWIGGYRGPFCNYTGSAMFDLDGNPTTDQTKDRCSGLLKTGCQPRFAAEQGTTHEWAIVNYGGSPTVDRLR